MIRPVAITAETEVTQQRDHFMMTIVTNECATLSGKRNFPKRRDFIPSISSRPPPQKIEQPSFMSPCFALTMFYPFPNLHATKNKLIIHNFSKNIFSFATILCAKNVSCLSNMCRSLIDDVIKSRTIIACRRLTQEWEI